MRATDQELPKDVKLIKWGKRAGVVFGFIMAAMSHDNQYVFTVWIAIACLCLELPIVSFIRAIRNGKAAE